mgnify:CR=1 FL=1
MYVAKLIFIVSVIGGASLAFLLIRTTRAIQIYDRWQNDLDFRLFKYSLKDLGKLKKENWYRFPKDEDFK